MLTLSLTLNGNQIYLVAVLIVYSNVYVSYIVLYRQNVSRSGCKAPISGGVIRSSGRSLDFMCTAAEQGRQASAGFKMPLAIIGLVYTEARVKFKNIDFRTEADFACYCNGPSSLSANHV